MTRNRAYKPALSVTLMVSVLITALSGPIHTAHGSEIVVTSLADSGAGSLRAALQRAAVGDTVRFGVVGTVELKSPLEVERDVRVLGIEAGSGEPAVRLDGARETEIMHVLTGSTVELRHITIANGRSPPQRRERHAGGIVNFGTLTVHGCTVQGNSGEIGGGIYNRGHLRVVDSLLADNHAGSGGAVFSWSPSSGSSVRIEGSVLAGNTAEDRGGAVLVAGGTDLAIHRTRIEGNSAGRGGGIYGRGTIEDSLIAGNEASDDWRSGGGLYLTGGKIHRSAIIANRGHYGGGVYVSRDATIANTTIAANESPTHDASGRQHPGRGAGVYDVGRLRLVNATVAYNAAGPNQGAGLHYEPDQHDDWFGVPPRLINTIIAHNEGENCAGPVTSDGPNLQYPAATCGEELPVADPRLEPHLERGRTVGYFLDAGSPAIGAGAATSCSVAPVSGVDQRGFSRPTGSGTRCDLGAIETSSQGVPTPGYLPARTATPLPADLVPSEPYYSLERPFTCYWPDMEVGLYAPFSNFGDTAAGAFEISVDGFRESAAGLDPGAHSDLFFREYGMVREHVVVVDADNQIVESHEENNERRAMPPPFTLPPYCTITPSATTPRPATTNPSPKSVIVLPILARDS